LGESPQVKVELMALNPVKFLQEVRQEVSKVTTLMVLAMVALASIFFLLADQIISWLIQTILNFR
jgi:preprotein translocase subunit SecE